MSVLPITSPILPSMKMSGRLSPLSHLPTAWGLMQIRFANSACDNPSFFLPSAIFSPTIFRFMFFSYCPQSQPQLHSGVHLHSVGVQGHLSHLQFGHWQTFSFSISHLLFLIDQALWLLILYQIIPIIRSF